MIYEAVGRTGGVLGGDLHPTSTTSSLDGIQQPWDQLKATADVLQQMGALVTDATHVAGEMQKKTANAVEAGGNVVATAGAYVAGAASAINDLNLVAEIKDKNAAARLEKTVLGSIKGVMTLAYFGSIWIPGQVVCGIVGFGLIVSALPDRLKGTGKAGHTVSEGLSLMIAPSKWFVNLLRSTYTDFKQAWTGKDADQKELSHVITDQTLEATFRDLEEEMSSIFDVKGEEVHSLRKVAAGISKTITLYGSVGTTVPLMISGVCGIGAMVSAYFNGKDVKQGFNVALLPLLTAAAVAKSIYQDFVDYMKK